jgi:hypothetical protein
MSELEPLDATRPWEIGVGDTNNRVRLLTQHAIALREEVDRQREEIAKLRIALDSLTRPRRQV